MMRSVGIRELKARASEIVREVRERQVEYVVTYRGRPMARLVPAGASPPSQADIDAYLAALDEIAAEIGRLWPEGVSAEDVMRDIRREL